MYSVIMAAPASSQSPPLEQSSLPAKTLNKGLPRCNRRAKHHRIVPNRMNQDGSCIPFDGVLRELFLHHKKPFHEFFGFIIVGWNVHQRRSLLLPSHNRPLVIDSSCHRACLANCTKSCNSRSQLPHNRAHNFQHPTFRASFPVLYC